MRTEIRSLGKWYTALVENESRGDACGACGKLITNGERVYAWEIDKTTTEWVYLHRDCLMEADEQENGVTEDKFELYRLYVMERHVGASS